MHIPENASVKINHHASTIISTMTSFISFLSTLPTVKSLHKSDRTYLCKHNIRPLILLNLHELGQVCYSEPWQVKIKFFKIIKNFLFVCFFLL